MKNKKIVGAVLAVTVLVGVLAAHQAEAISFRGFVDLLIEKGIIKGDKVEVAKKAADAVEQAEKYPNSTVVNVEVSQFIQFANREYEEGMDIEGLIMTVTNPTDRPIMLTARRRCAVSYKIHDEGEVVYDSAKTEACTTGETVMYRLEALQPRIFRVVHPDSEFHLEPGKYKFEIEYPGYGKGWREITILSES